MDAEASWQIVLLITHSVLLGAVDMRALKPRIRNNRQQREEGHSSYGAL